jgi:acid phosphatase (class A)
VTVRRGFETITSAAKVSACLIGIEAMPRGLLLFVLFGVLTSAGCAARKDALPAVPEFRPGIPMGYLQADALPNSLALLPAPPVADSVEMSVDQGFSQKSLAMRDTPAWTLATSDADLSFPHAANTFACALNAAVSETETPHLYMLMRRTLTDAALATYTAKNHYVRARPFTVNQAPICSPGEKGPLEKDGSYPSGHSAIGMAWSLILAEISPAQTDAILARGRSFAASRMVCNVHWHSDTVQGRYVGAYTVARLHADPTFEADLASARKELEAVRAKGVNGARDCSAEAEGIALQPSLVP